MKKYMLIPWLLAGAALNAQTIVGSNGPVPDGPGLIIGDNVPAVTIPRVINTRDSVMDLAASFNKLIIIDFWSTYCSGCVAGLPVMHTLQKQFGDSILILPVTNEKEQYVTTFLGKNKHTRSLNITSVVNDTLLSSLFHHRLIPHEVWIYKGKVLAFTLSDYVTEKNIRHVLQGNNITWPVKDDFLPSFKYDQPILQVNGRQLIPPGGPVRYAAIFGYRDGAANKQGVTYDSVYHVYRYYMINNTVLLAYFLNWHLVRDTGTAMQFPLPNRVLLEVKDPARYNTPTSQEVPLAIWRQQYLFCYEASLPDSLSGAALGRKVIADLDYLLSLHGRYEDREINCLVIKHTGILMDTTAPALPKLHIQKLDDLVWGMSQQTTNPPIINEAKETVITDLDITAASWTDLPAIRRSLGKYGLELREEKRTLEMFVLSDRTNQ